MSRTLSPTQIWAVIAYLQDQGGTVTVSATDLQAAEAAEPSGAVTAVSAAAPATGSTDPLEIMRGNQCFICHMLEGEGVELGPPFDGIGGRFSAEDIRRSILDPGAEASEGFEALLGAMPPNFGELMTAGQLEVVVQYLAAQE
jgi:mono/diheme cytochrome c family protein